MSQLHRVTLNGDFPHHRAHADERTYRAGVHAMTTDVRDAARAYGVVEASEPMAAPAPKAPRKTPAKRTAASAAPKTQAKPFPAKIPAKKPSKTPAKKA
jgi:hypothetical protein